MKKNKELLNKSSVTLIALTLLLLLASVHACSVLYDIWSHGSYAETHIGRIHSHLNRKLSIDVVSDIAAFILGIWAIIIAFSARSLRVEWRITIILGIVFVLYATVFPLLSTWNIVLSLFLKNAPFLSNAEMNIQFPTHVILEEKCAALRGDLHAHTKRHVQRCASDYIPGLPETSEMFRNDARCWKWVMLKNAGIMSPDAQHFGSISHTLARDPRIRNALVSILEPGTGLPPHVGYFKGFLRYHLGIDVPYEQDGRRPSLTVGGITYYWQNCEGVLFDDMYEHSVANPTTKPRAVLFVDVARDMPQPLFWLNSVMLRIFETHPLIKRIVGKQHAPKKNLQH